MLIPICDGDCSTSGGSNGKYHIIRIASFFLDYISFDNNPNNSLCKLTTSPKYGTSMVNIVDGNGSSSCMAGWFVRYVTSGPVGSGPDQQRRDDRRPADPLAARSRPRRAERGPGGAPGRAGG